VPVIALLERLFSQAAPLTSPLLALGVTLLVPVLRTRARGVWLRGALLLLAVAAFWAVYVWSAQWPAAGRWLAALNSPLFAVYLVLVLPALYLPRNRHYRLFLVVPAAILVLAVLSVIDAYGSVPDGDRGFYWFLIRPAWLIGGVASLLILIQPLLSLKWFRRAVRAACLIVLLYGGFAFRQSYADYQGMLGRRRDAGASVMRIMETSPVLQSDSRMTYVPSAPCRFSADGGYVQGCNVEMLQRLMQVDLVKAWGGDPGELSLLAVLFGAATMFFILCFLAGRWFCGWLCPLATLGNVLDWCRRRLGLPHLKPSEPVKLTYLFSGIGLSSLALLMAKAYPHLDADGRFLGCKIPLYPFCKICPGQQVCPVAAGGPGAWDGLPTWEWGFGFFRIACAALLALFLLSFVAGRQLWCRFCPMGIVSGVFNRGGMVRLTKDAVRCNQCGTCADVCPMDIDRVRADMEHTDVTSYHCILCLKCVEKCPRDRCLGVEHAGVKVMESRYDGGRT
jgi:ferredoxin